VEAHVTTLRKLLLAGCAALAMVGLAVLPAAAQETTCTVTKQSFKALHMGMSYGEAVKILGCHGDEISRVELGEFTTVMYAWSGGCYCNGMDGTTG